MRPREDAGEPRFGFTASRKVGNAVERNRARRRLKELVRLAGNGLAAPGHDYVLVARRQALTYPFGRLLTDFSGALRRLAQGRGASPQGGRGGKNDTVKNDTAERTRMGAVATIAQPGPSRGKGS